MRVHLHKAASSRLLGTGLALLALVGCQSTVSPSPLSPPVTSVPANICATSNSVGTSSLAPKRLDIAAAQGTGPTVVILYNDSNPGVLSARSIACLIQPGTVTNPFYPRHSKMPSATGQGVRAQTFSYGDAAQIYATMLANLVGRYSDLNISIRPVSGYKAGDAAASLRTFYIGSTYGDPVPADLVADAKSGAAITWMGYQIWNLVPFSNQIVAPQSPLGFSYVSLDSAYLPADYNSTYNKVEYRGFTYNKYLAPMEMSEIKIENPKVTVQAWAVNSAGNKIPYAIQSGNFWYISDIPFSYIHETDRYIAFADMLGPMLGHNETCAPKSLARMEDLSPTDDSTDLKRMLDVYQKLNIPFGATVIPLWKDAVSNTSATWQQNNASLKQVQRIPTIKGQVFQHGYTHQYENLLNPYGTTGDDFEFWRVTLNTDGSWNYVGPIPGMTPDSALARITTGRSILTALKINPIGWTTPHYAADPSYYAKFNTVYSRYWERRLYQVGDIIAGQFFPYPVRDVTGALILPENMGSVQPDYGVDKLLAAAKANIGLHCPWAGHFNHAYTLNPTYVGADSIGVTGFQNLLTSVQAMGYTYQDPASVTTQPITLATQPVATP